MGIIRVIAIVTLFALAAAQAQSALAMRPVQAVETGGGRGVDLLELAEVRAASSGTGIVDLNDAYNFLLSLDIF